MTLTLATLPKDAKAMPADAQALFAEIYNKDFGWRCSEGHAEKAAWAAVRSQWPQFGPKE